MPRSKNKQVNFIFKNRRIHVIIDKVLFLRFIRNLHGRFWGLAAILVMLTGFTLCFIIRPDMIAVSTAFSDFGNDVRTAPYFAASVFFAAYGLWRWRSYLSRTWKHKKPVTGLITLTVVGLWLVALMPVSWHPIPYKIHLFGVALAGFSMLATVIFDSILTKTKQAPHRTSWRIIRIFAVISILIGGWLTFGSAQIIGWYHIALLGESLLLFGYLLWICLKTYQGEGNRTQLAKILNKIVLVD